ncbi:MAG: SMC-Scp complex subunit ScpB [Bacteroidia bacterium]
MDAHISNIIESIIFTAEQPVKKSFLMEILQMDAPALEEKENEVEGQETVEKLEVDEASLDAALVELEKKYQSDQYPFEIRKVAEGYQFFTKRSYYAYIKRATLTKNQKRLSRSALETLAIIAYRQPITKAEMEFIRGVNCDYAVQKLLDKQLVSITGRAEAPGRPLLYATSPFFMQYFGIKDMTDMPKLKEFEELAEDHLEQFKLHQSQQQSDDADEKSESGPLLEGSEEGEEQKAEASTNGVGQEETSEQSDAKETGTYEDEKSE